MQFDRAAARNLLTERFPRVNGHPDVAGVFRDPELLALLGPALGQPFADEGVTAVVSPEARGPILGALVATYLGAGLVLARKANRNHPGADIHVKSDPTWRGTSETFQARSFDLGSRDRVIVVDDWVTTGSSIRATQNMLRMLGATYVGASVLVNKADSATLKELCAEWLVDFDAINDAYR